MAWEYCRCDYAGVDADQEKTYFPIRRSKIGFLSARLVKAFSHESFHEGDGGRGLCSQPDPAFLSPMLPDDLCGHSHQRGQKSDLCQDLKILYGTRHADRRFNVAPHSNRGGGSFQAARMAIYAHSRGVGFLRALSDASGAGGAFPSDLLFKFEDSHCHHHARFFDEQRAGAI